LGGIGEKRGRERKPNGNRKRAWWRLPCGGRKRIEYAGAHEAGKEKGGGNAERVYPLLHKARPRRTIATEEGGMTAEGAPTVASPRRSSKKASLLQNRIDGTRETGLGQYFSLLESRTCPKNVVRRLAGVITEHDPNP